MTRDENRGAEAARMAALHNLTGTADPRCWADVVAENERLRKLLAKAVLQLEVACRALENDKEAVDTLLAPYRAALEGER